MSRSAALVAMLALSGCGLLPRKIEYRYVQTYCISHDDFAKLKAQEPDKVHDHLNGDADHDAKILAASAVRLRAYSDGLLEVIGGCTEPDKQLAGELLNK